MSISEKKLVSVEKRKLPDSIQQSMRVNQLLNEKIKIRNIKYLHGVLTGQQSANANADIEPLLGDSPRLH